MVDQVTHGTREFVELNGHHRHCQLFGRLRGQISSGQLYDIIEVDRVDIDHRGSVFGPTGLEMVQRFSVALVGSNSATRRVVVGDDDIRSSRRGPGSGLANHGGLASPSQINTVRKRARRCPNVCHAAAGRLVAPGAG